LGFNNQVINLGEKTWQIQSQASSSGEMKQQRKQPEKAAKHPVVATEEGPAETNKHIKNSPCMGCF
jgi:hypothetical protein